MAVIIALTICAPAVNAAPFIFEVELNDSLLTATPVFIFPPTGSGGAGTLVGELEVGDLDFYQMDFLAPVLFTASMVGDVGEPEPHHPAIIGLFDSQGMLVAVDQDPLDVLSPSLVLQNPIPAGTYFLGISGGDDIDFTGDHGQEFQYSVIMDYLYVPAPAGALALVGGLFAGRFRRRR